MTLDIYSLTRGELRALGSALRSVMSAGATADPQDAYNAIMLYEAWTPDGVFRAGRVYKKSGRLYRCEQSHEGLNDPNRAPEIASSLWTQIPPPGAGSRDNPIPYDIGMELVYDLYYAENGIIYHCTEGLARSDWSLATLAAGQRFVEVVL